MLLPPHVSGPLTVASPGVWVSGALEGAQVQLLSNGAPLGAAVATIGPSVFVPLPVGSLLAGASISATQSKGADTSLPSLDGPVVAALPGPGTELPPVVFLSAVHPWVDWVRLGGLIPGATVHVRHRGKLVGQTLAVFGAESVRLTLPVEPEAEDIFEAFQTLTIAPGVELQGKVTRSLPLPSRPRSGPPAPVLTMPFECDHALQVSGLEDGASLVVHHGAQVLDGYPYVGPRAWAGLREPAHPGDAFSARQSFERWGLEGVLSAPPTGVSPSRSLPTPQVVGPICPDATVLRLRQLRPGATVWISARRIRSDGAGEGTTLGGVRAWATDCDVALPLGWALHPALQAAGELILGVTQENCGKGSYQATHPVKPLLGPTGVPVITPPTACASLIVVTGLTPGTRVEVLSDATDWPQLLSPSPVIAVRQVLALTRPLRAGELVRAKQSGCNAAAESAAVTVGPFPGVAAPIVESPVWIPHGGAWVQGCVLGARLHVFVQEQLRASVDVTAGRMFVPLTGLERLQRVTARQSMCDSISSAGASASVELGKLALTVSPAPITRTVPTIVRIDAVDRASGQPVAATVHVGSATVGVTGVPMVLTFGPGAPAPAAVNAPDYETEPIAWQLVDPPPPAQPVPRLLLALHHMVGNIFALQSVQWDVYRQVPGGQAEHLKTAQGINADIVLLPSQAGQLHIIATVVVTDRDEVPVYAEFIGNNPSPGINGQSTFLRVVGNGTVTLNFQLVNEPVAIWNGGTVVTLNKAVVRYHSG